MAAAAWRRFAGRFPQHLGALRHVGPIAPGPADRLATDPTARHGTQTPQHGLAVIARDGDDLRQQAAPLAASQSVIPLALLRQVLPYACARHGYPLRRGTRTSATYPSALLAITLQCRA